MKHTHTHRKKKILESMAAETAKWFINVFKMCKNECERNMNDKNGVSQQLGVNFSIRSDCNDRRNVVEKNAVVFIHRQLNVYSNL